MSNFFKQLQDAFLGRIKNTLFLSFIFSWLTVNYDISLLLLFGDDSIEEKVYFIQNVVDFCFERFVLYPILFVG
ncbi:MAG: hypothetical protein Q9N68_02350, partial [Gammaproteobacteria bacterium]|nr:hypothetical protein [Gammaproteobacteria bacterium]